MESPLPFDPALTCINYDVPDDDNDDDKPVVCPECGKCFKQKSIFSEHMQIHVEQKPYQCSECDRKFAQKSYLSKHALIHSAKKRHVCAHCGKGFGQRKHYVQHLLVHSGEKRYRCTLCSKKFSQKAHLDQHKFIHLGQRQKTETNPEFGECNLCDPPKKFSHKVSLKRHMLIHSGEKQFKCSECSKSFIRNDILQQHVKIIHLGTKDFACGECGHQFAHKSNLVKHMQSHMSSKEKGKLSQGTKNGKDAWMVKIPALELENFENGEPKGPENGKRRGRKRKAGKVVDLEEPENEANSHQVFLVEPKNVNEIFITADEQCSAKILELEAANEQRIEIVEIDDDEEASGSFVNNVGAGTGKSKVTFASVCKEKLGLKEMFARNQLHKFIELVKKSYPNYGKWVEREFSKELAASKQVPLKNRCKDFWKFKCHQVLMASDDHDEEDKIRWELRADHPNYPDLSYPSYIMYIVKVFEEFLDNVAEQLKEVLYNISHYHTSNELMIIEMQANCKDEVMVVVTAFNENFMIKNSLQNYLSHHDDDVNMWLDPDNDWNLKSLHYKTHKSNTELLYGVEEVYENFGNFKIGISMNIRSSISASGLRLLTNTIRNYLEPCQKTTLLEIGCGDGQIGLLLASKFKEVFGIDDSTKIKEARQLIRSNNVSNVICVQDDAKSVERIFKILRIHKNVVVIVNQTRTCGSSITLMEKLQMLKSLTRIVVVSNFLDQSFSSLLTLVDPSLKESPGPFVLASSCVVDTKPGENGYHCVSLMERKRFPKPSPTVKQEAGPSCDDFIDISFVKVESL